MKCFNPNCSNETSNPKFCSRSCSASYSNSLNPKRKLTRKCLECDSIVFSYRHYRCKKHLDLYKKNKYQDFTIGQYRQKESLKDKHRSWLHSHIRNFARTWFKDLTKLPCSKCGYYKHVELCHIIPVSSFPDDAKLSEVNSLKNLIQLCRNCHWELDNFHFKIIFNKEGFPEFEDSCT